MHTRITRPLISINRAFLDQVDNMNHTEGTEGLSTRPPFPPFPPCDRFFRRPDARSTVRSALVFLVSLLLQTTPAGAQATAGAAGHLAERPRVAAVQRTGAIVLDGALDEPAWATAPAATGFLQYQPREGDAATQRTEVRFARDDRALYVGARMYDSLGARGVRTRLVRRDQINGEGDWLQLVFDTYHDHAGRTVFTINPSGVRADAGQAAPGADPAWDPVWQAATRIDSAGWTAEIRIPFSQLRFPRDSAQTWGLQVWRYTERLGELDMWAFWGQQETGGPPRFGHLEGLRFRGRPGAVEVVPYVLARASYVAPTQPGSPFQNASRYDASAGADVRMPLGGALTLSATLNPDFGQVEQDPAVVNLSAFESYFDEKRPFFVEGSGLLFFGGFECFVCSNTAGMNVFYSRRIGRAPQGPVPARFGYADVPRNARLLGAAKVTGRTAGGWQVGVLEAVTGRAAARVEDVETGERTTWPVEPATNYFLGRVKRTTLGGRATWGVMATSVVRGFAGRDTVLAPVLSRHAESLGADWSVASPGQTYRLIGTFVLSSVSGDSQAIARLQRSSARYFQRPDRANGGNGLFSDRYDTAARGLRGFGGYLRASRDQGLWRWEAMVNYRSPGFEVNDIAFLQRADYVWMAANVAREQTRPGRWYRTLSWVWGAQQQFDFGGDRTDLEIHTTGDAQLRNWWRASVFAYVRPAVIDDQMTRGGAAVRRAWSWSVKPALETDPRARAAFSLGLNYRWFADGSEVRAGTASARWRPATNVEVQSGPSFVALIDRGQYVTQFDDPSATAFYGRRAVFAAFRQRSLSLPTRMSWTFTPALSLELFAQPFVSTGRYWDYQEYVRPRSGRRARFDSAQLSVAARDAAGRPARYRLDPDRDPATADFEFAAPDFSVRSLRGNAVLRWEYRPGSTLFVVWQQERTGPGSPGDFALARDVGGVFRPRPDNVFVVKATHRLGR
jgi:uncharacterized protein DUF5916